MIHSPAPTEFSRFRMPVSKLPPSGVLPAFGASSSVAPLVRFEPIRSARAFEDIAAQIRMEMTERRLQVGDKLPSERVLAEQFGVSRNTGSPRFQCNK